MAEEITSEVWRYAPDDVTGTRLLVLVRLANSAESDTRLTSVSIKTLVRETRASESSVHRAVRWLREHGIIQNLAEDEIPQWRKMYPSATRRITEREHWGAEEVLPDYRPSVEIPTIEACQNDTPTARMTPPIEQGDLESPVKRGANMTPSIKAISYKSSSTKTVQASPDPVESRSSRQRRELRELDDLDPAKALFPEDHPTQVTKSSKEPGRDTGMGLALYFARQYAQAEFGRTEQFIDWHNRTKLASSLNRWMRDTDVTPDLIRNMIDIYISRPDLHDTKKLAWLDLLAKRSLLGAEINAERLLALHEPETFNPADWTSQSPSQPREMSDADYEFDYEKWKRGQ